MGDTLLQGIAMEETLGECFNLPLAALMIACAGVLNGTVATADMSVALS